MSTSEVITPAPILFWGDAKDAILAVAEILGATLIGGYLGVRLGVWGHRLFCINNENNAFWLMLMGLGITTILCAAYLTVTGYALRLFDRQYGGIKYGEKDRLTKEPRRTATPYEVAYRKLVGARWFNCLCGGLIWLFFIAAIFAAFPQ